MPYSFRKMEHQHINRKIKKKSIKI